jgi:hypothetical protein
MTVDSSHSHRDHDAGELSPYNIRVNPANMPPATSASPYTWPTFTAILEAAELPEPEPLEEALLVAAESPPKPV